MRAAAAAAQGWQARLSLELAASGGRTSLTHCAHHGPLVVQKPLYPEGPRVCHVIVIHPPGGTAGGDDLALDIELGAGAKTLVTTPGAAKWYRSAGLPARQRLRAHVGAQASLEWLPQEAILFDGADASFATEVDIDAGGIFVGWEIACLGRAARGERFTTGSLTHSPRVRSRGTLLWQERGVLGGSDALLTSRVGLAGATVFGTLLAVGAAVTARTLERCRLIGTEVAAEGLVGMSAIDTVTVARYLGNSSQCARAALAAIWSELRPGLIGQAAALPRIWST